MDRPVPIPDEVSKPFWDAADQGWLVGQYCRDCADFQHPPARACRQCQGANLEFRKLSGKGTVYSMALTNDNRVRLLQQYQPFIIAIVVGDESERLSYFTNLPGTAPEDIAIGEDPTKPVQIGDPVEVEFEDVGSGRRIPQFHVVRTT